MGIWARRALLLAISGGGGLFVLFGQGPFFVFLAALAAALGLYGLRETDRKLYGAAEIIFAAFGLLSAAERTHGSLAAEFADAAQATHWPEILLQMGASIYVLVRSFDNFGMAAAVRGFAANRSEP